jgi:DNA-directed RNA polymerase alpha subunit
MSKKKLQVVDDLGLQTMTMNMLKAHGVYYIKTLLAHSINDLAVIPNIGVLRVKEITSVLAAHGLALRALKIDVHNQ